MARHGHGKLRAINQMVNHPIDAKIQMSRLPELTAAVRGLASASLTT